MIDSIPQLMNFFTNSKLNLLQEPAPADMVLPLSQSISKVNSFKKVIVNSKI